MPRACYGPPPVTPSVHPYTTLESNVTGCALIGVNIACLCRIRAVNNLAPALLPTGILGGFTTFSTAFVAASSGLVTGTAAAASPPQVQALIGTGLAGALSTFSYQTLRLAEEGFRLLALAYILISMTAGSPPQQQAPPSHAA